MTAKTMDGETATYTYNAANQLVTETQGTKTIEYIHNQNGDLIAKSTGERYTYDIQGNLTSVIGNGVNQSYTYNASGTRLSKTENGSTIEYVSDINLPYEQVLQTYDQDGQLLNTYNYGVQRICATGQDTETYLYDGRGSVSGVVTDNSKLISYSYTAYGDLLPESPEPKVYGYNAEETDYTTGLQYLRARYYNTDTGNFIQKDAYKGDFTQPGTLNRYAYCGGNPINSIDPSGYRPIEGVDVTDPSPSGPTTETPIDTTDINQIDYSGDSDANVLDAIREDTLPPWEDEYIDGYREGFPIIDTWFMEILELNALYTQYLFDTIEINNANMLNANHRKLFTELVTDNGPMDIKNTLGFKKTQYWFNGELLTIEDLGNINYGFIGRSVGISRITLIQGSLQNAKEKANQAMANALANGISKKEARKIKEAIINNEKNVDRPQILKGIEMYNAR